MHTVVKAIRSLIASLLICDTEAHGEGCHKITLFTFGKSLWVPVKGINTSFYTSRFTHIHIGMHIPSKL